MTFLVLSTRLCISRLLLETSKQVSGICLFNRDIFHNEEFMGAYVTHRSTLPVAAAASNSNSEPPKTSTDSPGPTSTSKEERHPSSPDAVRPHPKAGPRRSQNVSKKKRTNATLTDTAVKNAVKNTMHILEQMRKTGPRKRGNRSVYNISSEIFTKQTPKNINESKNASDTKEGGSKDTLCCSVLTHIIGARPEKCGFSAYSASCGHMKNALIAIPPLFAQIASPMDRNTFV